MKPFRNKNEPLVVPQSFEENPELLGFKLEEEDNYDGDFDRRVWYHNAEFEDGCGFTLEVKAWFMNVRTDEGLKELQQWSFRCIFATPGASLVELSNSLAAFDYKEKFEEDVKKFLPYVAERLKVSQ